MKKIYSSYDVLAKECGELFSVKNDALARRMYEDAVASGKIKEADYKLICLGVYFNDYDESSHVGIESGEEYPYFVEHSALENCLADGE